MKLNFDVINSILDSSDFIAESAVLLYMYIIS